MGISETGESSASKKRRSSPTTLEHVDADILCIIFSFLNLFDLVPCTVVCKSWNATIKRFQLLQASCRKMRKHVSSFPGMSTSLELSAEIDLEEFAMKHNRMTLLRGQIDIDRWKCHSDRVSQCRLKNGLVLTGVGDKVMRLWSLNSYRCIEEYSLPVAGSLVDFDFDESKIVGLVGTRIAIWRRNGQRSIFPSREGMFPRGLCMRYIDPEAVVGCEDGTARVFDMYSKTCSRIIRTRAGPLTCLSLSEDQLILGGSSLGEIVVSDPLCDQPVATLRSMISAGGIKTLCFNPCSYQAFSGTTAGYVSCWDLRRMGQLWERRVSSNVVYSLHHVRGDMSVMGAGGIDGVFRIMEQSTGRVVQKCIMDDGRSRTLCRNKNVMIERRRGRRVVGDIQMDEIERMARPPISCLAVGMKKIVMTHGDRYISIWKFDLS